MELSVQEEKFVRQSLAARAIPSPKPLIKDHKKINNKRRTSNQVGNPRDKLYRNFLQNRLPWDQTDVVQGKSELLTRFRRPGIRPKGKT